MNESVIIALDFASGREALAFLDSFGTRRPFVKVGMELFYAEGPEILKALKARNHPIFLDLKLHDIPNTVERAMRVLGGLGVDMANVHAAGTMEMMRRAKEGLLAGAGVGKPPRLLAVTQLTSTSEAQMQEELGIAGNMKETVLRYAKQARAAGLDGVICSPQETAAIHAACGAAFLTVTPGIRFAESAKDDQARSTTPEQARKNGSDFIVVGRPITRAADPVAAYLRCVDAFQGGGR